MPQPVSEETFPHSGTTLNPEHIREAVSGTAEVPIEGPPGGGADGPTRDGEAGEGGSQVVEGWPSPNTKLQRSRSKRRRVPGLASVLERLMEHSSRLFEKELEERHRERMEDAEMAEQRELSERQDRMMVQEVIRQNIEVMKSVAEAFNEFVAIQRARANAEAAVGSGVGEGERWATSLMASSVAAGTTVGSVQGVPCQAGPSNPQAATPRPPPNKRIRMKKKFFSS